MEKVQERPQNRRFSFCYDGDHQVISIADSLFLVCCFLFLRYDVAVIVATQLNLDAATCSILAGETRAPRADHAAPVAALLGIKNGLLGPLIAIVRIVLLALLSLLLLVLDLVAFALGFLPTAQHAWRRLIYGLIGRLALGVIGFWSISTTTVSLRRGASSSSTGSLNRTRSGNGSKKRKPGHKVKIVIANHTSYLDVLYLAYRYAPMFTHVSASGKIRLISFWQALFTAGEYPNLEDEQDSMTLNELIAHASSKSQVAPIVIFPEGTTSNGRGILKFLPVFKDFVADSNVLFELVGFKYIYGDWCTCYTVGSRGVHFLWTLTRFANTLDVRILLPSEVALSTDPLADSGSLEEDPAGSQLSSQLAQMLRMRKVSKNAVDKQSFLDFYNEREARNYAKKNK
eukprot:jgi/Hompol1/6898/HPOL_005117-RA